MKDIQRIIDATASKPEETFVLATVVNVVGSAYRRPGARMLIASTGETWNAISGGCLEGDVVERARKVLATGVPTLVTYDLTAEDASNPWGLGMGCNGAITVLIEPFDPSLLTVFTRCFQDRRRLLLATVVGPETSAGTRVAIEPGGTVSAFHRALPPGDALVAAIVEIGAAPDRLPGINIVRTEGEAFEVFFERLDPPVALHLFGAGYDAVPLARLADELGWRVRVYDHRPAFATSDRFPTADRVLRCDVEQLASAVGFDDRSAAVVMTHNFQRDRDILAFLLTQSPPYVGVLGPKRRTDLLLSEIGVDPGAERGLFSPVGLDIGAETAEEIALAILAEIRAVFSGHRAGFLKDRKGPIHT